MKHREATPIKTEGVYLNRLGKKLLYYFPLEQVRDMLEDYQEHFSLGRERGSTDEALISALGTPEAVTAAILQEMSEGRSYFFRHAACWGTLFLFVCFWLVVRYTDQLGWSFYRNTFRDAGSCILLLLSAAACFALLRGREQAAMESRFSQPSLRPKAVSYVLPLGLAVLMEILTQVLLTAAQNDWLTAAPENIGPLFNAVLNFSQLIIGLLMIWNLWRAYSASVRYFPAAVHAAGAFLPIREIQRHLRSMDISFTIAEARHRLLLPCLLIYGGGLILTLLFRYYICSRNTGRGKG